MADYKTVFHLNLDKEVRINFIVSKYLKTKTMPIAKITIMVTEERRNKPVENSKLKRVIGRTCGKPTVCFCFNLIGWTIVTSFSDWLKHNHLICGTNVTFLIGSIWLAEQMSPLWLVRVQRSVFLTNWT